jgi:hypothetical protein
MMVQAALLEFADSVLTADTRFILVKTRTRISAKHRQRTAVSHDHIIMNQSYYAQGAGQLDAEHQLVSHGSRLHVQRWMIVRLFCLFIQPHNKVRGHRCT